MRRLAGGKIVPNDSVDRAWAFLSEAEIENILDQIAALNLDNAWFRNLRECRDRHETARDIFPSSEIAPGEVFGTYLEVKPLSQVRYELIFSGGDGDAGAKLVATRTAEGKLVIEPGRTEFLY